MKTKINPENVKGLGIIFEHHFYKFCKNVKNKIG